VSISGERLPSSWAERYPTVEVPGELSVGGCRPVALSLVTMPDGRDLIQFGELSYGALCLDPSGGRVVDIVTGRAGDVARGPLLVNSSLQQYVVTVDRATARFPYDDGSEDPDFDAIADDLRAHLAPIDPPAWDGDGYWDTFYWDVTIGDYHSILFKRP
jgi:hypothetical protein